MPKRQTLLRVTRDFPIKGTHNHPSLEEIWHKEEKRLLQEELSNIPNGNKPPPPLTVKYGGFGLCRAYLLSQSHLS